MTNVSCQSLQIGPSQLNTRQDNMRLTTLFISQRKRRRMNQSGLRSRRSSRHWQLTLIDWPSFPPCLLIQYTAYKTCHWMNPSGERDRDQEGSVHLLAVYWRVETNDYNPLEFSNIKHPVDNNNINIINKKSTTNSRWRTQSLCCKRRQLYTPLTNHLPIIHVCLI